MIFEGKFIDILIKNAVALLVNLNDLSGVKVQPRTEIF